MGLLPYLADAFTVSISDAGKTITWYAIGVVVGAVFMIFCQRFNLKKMMLVIIVLQLIGIIMTPLSPNFSFLLLARFVSGLPHGCFFGVGAIIAQRVATNGKGNSAMAIMIAGQTLSNIFGVPLGTFLAHTVSWHAIFYIMACWGVIVLISMIIYLPDTGKLESQSFLGQFTFLKRRASYLVFGTIMLDSIGIFAIETFESPMLTDHVGIDLIHVPTVLIAVGFSMMIFNLISGKIADRFTPGKTVCGFLSLAIICVLLLAFVGQHSTVVGIISLCFLLSVLFGVGTPQQVAVVRCAKGGELLGVALSQVCFNAGNAVGAAVGGIPLKMGFPFHSLCYVGFVFIVLAWWLAFIYAKNDEKKLLIK